MPTDFNRSRRLAVCMLLAVATLAVYWQVRRFEFTNYDDWEVALKNPMVHRGVTVESVAWALTTHYYDYWHPLAWLSHMLDVQLFGLNPGMHHLSSVFIHVGNVLLVFLVFRRLTGAWGRSAFVAALFALHPLNVDSVAWIAERKNVLSTTFWLLTLWAYVRYVERPVAARYLAALALFALGLMAKPMLVTLPFVLLLLDYWPLGRLKFERPAADFKAGPSNSEPETPKAELGARRSLPRLLLEKLPFFLLTAGSLAVTYGTAAAKGYVVSTAKLPMLARLLSVPVAYAAYLWKLIWPVELSVLYPHPGFWPLGKVAAASLILLLISLAVLTQWRKRPYLVVGWLWFLGTLVPVIGIIQTGAQYIADRWTYVPHMGLFVMLVWGAADLTARWPSRRIVLQVAGAAALVACAGLTLIQVRHWRNTVTLFTHALAVTSENSIAHYNLGLELMSQGKVEEPLWHFGEAVRIRPDYEDAHNNLGLVLASLGRWEEATNHFIRAFQAKPTYDKAHNNLGTAFFTRGQLGAASNQFAQALSLNPTNADARYNLGVVMLNLGHSDEALAQLAQALRLAPLDAANHNWMGKALAAQDRIAEAIAQYTEALRLQRDYQDAHFNLGVALGGLGEFTGAIEHLAEALRLNPEHAEVHSALGSVLAAMGRSQEAVAHYREALRQKPDLPEALNNLAWILATHPAAETRNGGEALELAERACTVTGRKQPMFLGTLAAAFAETGQFGKAVEAAQAACELAESLGQTNVVATNRMLLDRCRRGEPWRSPP